MRKIHFLMFWVVGTLHAQFTVTGVSPESADPGTSGLTVTFNITDSTPPTPPAGQVPTSVTIGTISGTSITHETLGTVTAVFDIPVDEVEESKDVTITFSTPGGDVEFTGSDAFTVGAVASDYGNGPPSSGYNLFSPLGAKDTYLMDNDYNVIKTWSSSYTPGNALYLLDDGSLIRTANTESDQFDEGGAGGRVEQYDWDGNLIWSFDHDTANYRTHHDIEVLPNGNVLMIAWELKTQAEAEAAGRDPSLLTDGELWPDYIIEVEPTGSEGGDIVWEWHVWDHLVQDYDATADNYGVVADHPEKIDLNYVMSGAGGSGADWNHINSIDYNAELGHILLSVRNFSEIWIIDHNTTTEEAAGSAGDLLYRWGNPQTYDSGDSDDQQLFVQHDAHWIEEGYSGEGNILIFNNGSDRSDGDYSSVDEIVPPIDEFDNYTLGLPLSPEWTYTSEVKTDFYAGSISGARRLKNGNTLICEGTENYAFEVTSEGDLVWDYTDTILMFRFERYAPDFAGFENTELALPTVSYPIVDTGQVKSYNDTTEIDAPESGEDFYGQDTSYDGNQPLYDKSPDGLTVYDYNTGLTWTQSPDLNGDSDINVDDKLTQSEAADYAATLNAMNYGGYNDWRLPSIKEIYSLMDFRGTDPMNDDTSTLVPFIDTDYFDFGYGDTDADERTIDAQFATTTIYVDLVMTGQTAMFGLNLADGRIKGYPTSISDFYVLYCRGNTDYGANDFQDNGDGTVTDRATGLMWQQADSGSAELWADVLSSAESAEIAGYDDWRLPNAKELQSILDYTRSPGTTSSAAIDPIFSSTAITNEGGEADYPWYFASTTHAKQDGSGDAAVYMAFGRATGYFNDAWTDVHGAGAQRSESKELDLTGYTYEPDGYYFTSSPQGDAARFSNYFRLVRDADLNEASAPEIAVTGNDEAIADGASTTSSSNGTSFGNVALSSGNSVSTFTIENSGDDSLSVTGITLSGTHSSDFTVGGISLPVDVSASSSTTFTVTFDPSALGERTAEVSIANDDADENPYTFALSGTGISETGDLEWTFRTGDTVFASPAVDSDGVVYFGSTDSNLYAIDPNESTTTAKWTFQAGDQIESSAAIIDGDSIFVGSWDSKLYSIDAETGEKNWEYETGSSISASPALGSDSTVYVGSNDGYLYAIHYDGTLNWRYQVEGEIHSSVAIDSDGILYFGTVDGKLIALNDSAELQWSYQTETISGRDNRIAGSPAIGIDGEILIGSGNYKLYAIDSDGRFLWAYETGGIVDSSPVVDSDGDIYFGCRDGYYYCLNAQGSLKWRVEVGEIQYSSPALDDSGNSYIASSIDESNSVVIALDEDGGEIWRYVVAEAIDSSPAISDDGTLLIGAYDGKVYALEAEGGFASAAVWPKFRGDLANSGNQAGAPETEPTYDTYFSLATEAAVDGWLDVPGLEQINIEEFPWIYHTSLSWLYADGQGGDSYWFYDFELDWIWTNSDIFPWVWSEEYDSWLYDYSSATDARWLYDGDSWFSISE